MFVLTKVVNVSPQHNNIGSSNQMQQIYNLEKFLIPTIKYANIGRKFIN